MGVMNELSKGLTPGVEWAGDCVVEFQLFAIYKYKTIPPVSAAAY